jgi:hypothetical protein
MGRPETTGEIMKYIMAILLYRKSIDDLKNHASDPANFADNLYQPEKMQMVREYIIMRITTIC